jgi:hypothetical protein
MLYYYYTLLYFYCFITFYIIRCIITYAATFTNILSNTLWAHIRGLNRSGREADLSHLHLTVKSLNALCYSSIPHTPSRRVAHASKKMEHPISCTGSVIQLIKRRAFVELNMAKWRKVCSSLLAARVAHIQWDALCGPASPVIYRAHCASHCFNVKTTRLFVRHVADKPTALYTDIHNTAGCLQTQQGGPTTKPQWYTHQLPASTWTTIRWNDKHGERVMEWQTRRENEE